MPHGGQGHKTPEKITLIGHGAISTEVIRAAQLRADPGTISAATDSVRAVLRTFSAPMQQALCGPRQRCWTEAGRADY